MWLRLLSLSLLYSIGIYSGFSQQNDQGKHIDAIESLIETSRGLYESTPDSALLYADSALRLATRYKIDSLKAKIHIAISVSYSYMADYSTSIENSFKALSFAEKFKDTVSVIDAYNNLGIDFLYQDDFASSEKYFQNVRQLSADYGDSLRLGHSLNNLGLIESEKGDSQAEVDYYERASIIFLAIGEEEGYANTLLNIGTVYTEIERFEDATKQFELAQTVYKKLSYASAIEHTLLSMAENYQAQGKYSLAEKSALEGLEICKQNGIVQDLPYAYELLSNIYAGRGAFQAAYRYHQKYFDVQDSLFNSEKSLQIRELKTKYESEKKQQQIALLTTKNQLNELNLEQKKKEEFAYVFAIIFLLSMGGFLGYVLVNRARLKERLLAEEIDNLRLRINSLVEGSTKGLDIKIEELNSRLINPLSEREFEILMLAVSDQNNSSISDKLFVSVNTVKYHLKNIYEKLGVNNRKEALQFAVRSSS